jgi:hypothetical protein
MFVSLQNTHVCLLSHGWGTLLPENNVLARVERPRCNLTPSQKLGVLMEWRCNREDLIVYFAGRCNLTPLEVERSNRESVLIERALKSGEYVTSVAQYTAVALLLYT